MRDKLSKLLSGVLLLFLGVVNFIYAKVVHAMVIYAPPEVFEREARTNLFFDFIKEYTGLVVFISLLAVVGLISIVRVLLLKILRKKQQNQNIQPPKPTDELPKQ